MKLPTDSLYKFLGIFGIILFLGSGWLKYKTGENVLRFFEEARQSVKESSEFQKSFLEYNSKLMSAAEKIAKGNLEEGKSESNKMMNEINRIVADDIATRGLMREKLKYQMDRDISISNLLFFTSIFGLLMAGSGIYAWYLKLQTHIDSKIKSGNFTVTLNSSDIEVKAE